MCVTTHAAAAAAAAAAAIHPQQSQRKQALPHADTHVQANVSAYTQLLLTSPESSSTKNKAFLAGGVAIVGYNHTRPKASKFLNFPEIEFDWTVSEIMAAECDAELAWCRSSGDGNSSRTLAADNWHFD